MREKKIPKQRMVAYLFIFLCSRFMNFKKKKKASAFFKTSESSFNKGRTPSGSVLQIDGARLHVFVIYPRLWAACYLISDGHYDGT